MEYVAEVCMMYGWTEDYVLKMPFHRFCSMLKNGRRIHSKRMIELIDIQSISIGNGDRYLKIRESYTNLFDYERIKQENPKIDASNPHHINAMKKIFRGIRRG